MTKCYGEECEYNAQPNCALSNGMECPHGVKADKPVAESGTDIEKLIRKGKSFSRKRESIEDELIQDLITALSTLQAENAEMQKQLNEFSEFLCHITGGLLSKTNYSAQVMISAAEDYQQKGCGECDLRAENIRWGQVASEQDKAVERLQEENEKLKNAADSWKKKWAGLDKAVKNGSVYRPMQEELNLTHEENQSLKDENEKLRVLAELGNTRAKDYRVMRDRAVKAEEENKKLRAELEQAREKNSGLALALLTECAPNPDCLGDDEWRAIRVELEQVKKCIEIVEFQRDAAIDQLHGYCPSCTHYTPNHNEGPCRTCKYEYYHLLNNESLDNWEWHGPHKED